MPCFVLHLYNYWPLLFQILKKNKLWQFNYKFFGSTCKYFAIRSFLMTEKKKINWNRQVIKRHKILPLMELKNNSIHGQCVFWEGRGAGKKKGGWVWRGRKWVESGNYPRKLLKHQELINKTIKQGLRD